jgi:hypothetical protein
MIEALARELGTSAWAPATRALALRIWSMVCRGLRAHARASTIRYLKHEGQISQQGPILLARYLHRLPGRKHDGEASHDPEM